MISLDFKPHTAIITATDPITEPNTDNLDVISTIKVRNDSKVSSQINSEQLARLNKGETYIVYIEPWVLGNEHFQGTELATIYYSNKDQHYNLKDHSKFSECDLEDCTRVTKP